MRLIDADKLKIDDLCDICNSADCANCFSDKAFEQWIANQPTAYDTNKIVEQLKESDEILRVYPKLQPHLTPICEQPYPLPKPKPVSLKPIKCIPLTDAIEIVKSGGKV